MAEHIANCVYGFGRAFSQCNALVNMAAHNRSQLRKKAEKDDDATIRIDLFEIEGDYDLTPGGPQLHEGSEIVEHEAFEVSAGELFEIGEKASDLDIDAEVVLVEGERIDTDN